MSTSSTERHAIPVADRESVVAIHHAAPTERWLVFCHGLRSDKSGSYERRCRRAVEEGYNAVRFDARGCGESDGEFVDATLSSRLADLGAVVEYFDPGTYALFGSSFGGTVALHAATRDAVAAVATRAPVTYARAFEEYRDTVESGGVYEFEDGCRLDGRFFADLDDRPFEDAAARIDVPVAIFHGGHDGSVPVADSFAAARALDTDVLVEKFAEEGHVFSEGAEARMRERLFCWLDTVRTDT